MTAAIILSSLIRRWISASYSSPVQYIEHLTREMQAHYPLADGLEFAKKRLEYLDVNCSSGINCTSYPSSPYGIA